VTCCTQLDGCGVGKGVGRATARRQKCVASWVGPTTGGENPGFVWISNSDEQWKVLAGKIQYNTFYLIHTQWYTHTHWHNSIDNMYIYTYKIQCIVVFSIYTLQREINTGGNARERANSEILHITCVYIWDSTCVCVCVCVCQSGVGVCVRSERRTSSSSCVKS